MESTNYNIKYMIFSSSIIYTVKKSKASAFALLKKVLRQAIQVFEYNVSMLGQGKGLVY